MPDYFARASSFTLPRIGSPAPADQLQGVGPWSGGLGWQGQMQRAMDISRAQNLPFDQAWAMANTPQYGPSQLPPGGAQGPQVSTQMARGSPWLNQLFGG